ncbi:hypothetical protein [Prosthecobacter sp.]|uniref:hypothetical protein n=1 Tax=Prosthecobacter sp. TaxID=1965333 RepID=UPI003783FD44
MDLLRKSLNQTDQSVSKRRFGPSTLRSAAAKLIGNVPVEHLHPSGVIILLAFAILCGGFIQIPHEESSLRVVLLFVGFLTIVGVCARPLSSSKGRSLLPHMESSLSKQSMEAQRPFILARDIETTSLVKAIPQIKRNRRQQADVQNEFQFH